MLALVDGPVDGLPSRLELRGEPPTLRLGRPSAGDTDAADWRTDGIPHQCLSRRHVMLTLAQSSQGNGPHAVLTQLGVNGSLIRSPGSSTWTKVTAGSTADVAFGSSIIFGPATCGKQPNPVLYRLVAPLGVQRAAEASPSMTASAANVSPCVANQAAAIDLTDDLPTHCKAPAAAAAPQASQPMAASRNAPISKAHDHCLPPRSTASTAAVIVLDDDDERQPAGAGDAGRDDRTGGGGQNAIVLDGEDYDGGAERAGGGAAQKLARKSDRDELADARARQQRRYERFSGKRHAGGGGGGDGAMAGVDGDAAMEPAAVGSSPGVSPSTVSTLPLCPEARRLQSSSRREHLLFDPTPFDPSRTSLSQGLAMLEGESASLAAGKCRKWVLHPARSVELSAAEGCFRFAESAWCRGGGQAITAVGAEAVLL